MDDNKFWIWVWGFALIAFCVVIVSSQIYYYKETKLAFENGYEEQTLVGYNTPKWVKIKK